jgi:hypothetical protein
MGCLKRWLVAMSVGVTLSVVLTNCIVSPVAPAPLGYVVSPPVVVIRPYRPYRPYHPYRHYRPYGRYPYAYRW